MYGEADRAGALLPVLGDRRLDGLRRLAGLGRLGRLGRDRRIRRRVEPALEAQRRRRARRCPCPMKRKTCGERAADAVGRVLGDRCVSGAREVGRRRRRRRGRRAAQTTPRHCSGSPLPLARVAAAVDHAGVVAARLGAVDAEAGVVVRGVVGDRVAAVGGDAVAEVPVGVVLPSMTVPPTGSPSQVERVALDRDAGAAGAVGGVVGDQRAQRAVADLDARRRWCRRASLSSDQRCRSRRSRSTPLGLKRTSLPRTIAVVARC